jgi:hypothetical protein
MTPKSPKRPYRLNIRLSKDEYDALYRYFTDNRCDSMDSAIRLLIRKHTPISSGGAKVVPKALCTDVVQ